MTGSPRCIAAYEGRLPLLWRRSAVANACHARNLGLALARGELVGFPDDDCLLPAGLLDRVSAGFAADPALAVLTGPAASPDGGPGLRPVAGGCGAGHRGQCLDQRDRVQPVPAAQGRPGAGRLR